MKLKFILIALVASSAVNGQTQSLSLQECIDMALQNNAELRKARLDIQMADEDKAEAFTHYFPQVSAMGAGFVGAKDLMRGEMEMPALEAMMPGMGAFPLSMIKKGVVATLTALQPLYAGGQILTGNRLAAVQQEVRQLQTEMTEKDVRQNVQQYYWKLVSLRGNVGTLDAIDKQLSEVHQLTTNYVEAGVTNRNDLLRVELKQQEVASQRLTLQNGIELVRMLLAQLCGADLATFDITSENILEPQSPESAFIPADQALGNREEVQLLDRSVEASNLQVRMERGKNLPSVAVGASGMYYNVMEKNQGNLVGLATVSVPISSWWGGSHAIRKARMKLEQDRLTLHDTQEKLQIDILSAWNNLQEAYAQIEIARRSVTQADENLRLSRDQYDAGTMGMTDLLDAVTLYTQSHNSLLSACADYQSRLAEYQRKTK
ncbi:MAG: TolC family protein [Bacteroidaceae bacterium]|nr:TolC family protein [Bacteroidaceae bacterium]